MLLPGRFRAKQRAMVTVPYTILDVSDWPLVADEPQGGKKKSWLLEPGTTRHWLFKDKAQGGDDWAERVAREIADALLLPCAVVELAKRSGTPGALSLDFTENRVRGDLVLGNDLLLEHDPLYPSSRQFRVTAHTVDKVMEVLSNPNIKVPPNQSSEVETAAHLFLGYLLLDALISNTDRHHENWGILRLPKPGEPLYSYLAPSFDHAASLGQILTDDERQRRLETRDAGYGVPAFVRRARSALYQSAEDGRPLSVIDAFTRAGRHFPKPARYWQRSLAGLSHEALEWFALRVPDEVASPWAKRFAARMLHTNQQILSEVSFS